MDLLEAVLLVSPGAPPRRGALTLAGGRIAAVREAAGPAAPARRAVLPGLVNAHTHLFQTMARGLAPGRALAAWHGEVIRPLYQALTADDVRAFTLLGALDAQQGGAGAVVKVQAFPNDVEVSLAAAEAMARAGLRGVHVKSAYVAGAPAPMLAGPRRALADAEALLRQPPVGGLVRFWVGVPTVLHAPGDWLRELMAMAVDAGARVHLHLAESEAEATAAARALGMREVPYLDRLGLLRPELVVAHAVALTDDEIALLADRGVGVVHCPVSNLYLRSGIARVGRMRQRGMRVALGTDGPASNDAQDMFGTMKAAALVAGLRDEPVAPDDVLAMATADGARLLGLDGGTLAPGAAADLTVVSLTSARVVPVHRVVHTLVFACTPADLEAVVVDGRPRLRHGRIDGLDEAAVVDEAQRRAAALVRRAGLAHLRDGTLDV
ncbi:MAG: amidohydrolase family protein [Armatimonadota bacterium]|nr:amidohydrolase family protein [Armatimonadota bacterium]